MKILKYFTITFAILCASLIILAIGFIAFFDVSKYKIDIENMLTKALKRNVEIKGDIGLTFFPLFSLKVEDIRVNNPSSFKEKDFLVINKINLALDLVKLLKDRALLVKSISLVKPEFNLITLDNGTSNWEGLFNNSNTNVEKSQVDIENSEKSKRLEILIENITIEKGKISVNDKKAKRNITVAPINVVIKNLGKEKTGHYQILADVKYDKYMASFGAAGSVKKSGDLISFLGNQIEIKNIKVNNEKIPDITCSFEGQLDSNSKVFTLNNIAVSNDTFKMIANLQTTTSGSLKSLTGNVDFEKKIDSRAVKFKSDFNYKDNILKFPTIFLSYGGIKGTGSTDIKLGSEIYVSYSIDLGEVNLNDILADNDKKKIKGSKGETNSSLAVFNLLSKIKGINMGDLSAQGNVIVKKLVIDNQTLQKLTLHNEIKNNKFLTSLKFDYKKSSFSVSSSFEAKQNEVTLSLNTDVDNLFIKDILGKTINNLNTLNNSSLTILLKYNGDKLTFQKVSFNTFINNKERLKVDLNGDISAKNGDIRINPSHIVLNSSDVKFSLNSNLKTIFNTFNGICEGILNVRDLAFIRGRNNLEGIRGQLNVKSNFNVSVKDKLIRVENIELTYGHTHLKGAVTAVFNEKQPTFNLSMSGDSINADELMALYDVLKGEKNKDQKISSKGQPNGAGDFNAPKVDINADIDRLIFKKLVISKIVFKGIGEASNYAIDINGILYGGRFRGILHINTSQDEPTFNVSSKVMDIYIDKLLLDLVDNPIFTGLGDLDVDLQTSGNNSDEIINKLNGKMSVDIQKGTLKGLNLGFILRNIFSLIEEGKLTFNQSMQDYSGVKGTFDVTNGVFSNKDLLISSPFFKIRGEGYIDIPKNYIDYNMYLSFLKPAFDNNTQKSNVIYKNLLDKEILIEYKGPLNKPQQNIDYKSYVEKILGIKLEPLKRKVNKFLQDIF
jgi:uncharacterized protein involved in outer membrane biogenesis